MAPQEPFLLPRYHSAFDNTPKFGSPVLDFLHQKCPHTQSISHRPDFGCNQTSAMSEEADQFSPLRLAVNGQLPLDTLPRVTQDIEFDIAAFLALPSVQFRLLHQYLYRYISRLRRDSSISRHLCWEKSCRRPWLSSCSSFPNSFGNLNAVLLQNDKWSRTLIHFNSLD